MTDQSINNKLHNDTSHNIVTAKDELSEVIDKSELTMPLVAVYCGSRVGNNPIYAETAEKLGKALAENGLGLVYGGASIGLMGKVADGVLASNAQAVGVIPSFMLQREVAHKNLTKLHLTDTMHTRKAVMAEYADAFIALAGGLGTLEEILEIATWQQLFQHKKPMILLNINGYYNHLIEHLRFSVDEGFISGEDMEKLLVCEDIDSAIEALQNSVFVKDELRMDRI